MRGLRLLTTAAVTVAVALASPGAGRGQEPEAKVQVVTPKDDGIIATGINSAGDIVGFEWIESREHPGVVEQVPFYAREKAITYLPRLAGYTATFPAAVSDAGVVVGRASKPAPPGVAVPLRNQGFVWDAATGIHGLGTLEGDLASFATGITRDGERISGFSVGENRVRACYWDRNGDGWKVAALPQEGRLGSSTVPISDNGKYLAAVDGLVPCLWSQNHSGGWTREVLGEPGSLIPRAVNNRGTVVGVRHSDEGWDRAVVRTRDQAPRVLDLPAGYVTSEASSVNNDGVVVGIADGPNGSPIGPHAFVYENGRLRLIHEAGPAFTAATAINDRRQVAGVFEKPEEPAPPPKERKAP